MQKKLIALAIAGLGLTASAAFAQTNVTIYGIMDASVDVVDNGDPAGGAQGIRTNKISSNASRLGFKGVEDLGDGLKAIFQIESGINADNNGGAAGTLNSRNTYVGLAGGWGSVKLGNIDTPYKTSTRGYDMFNDHLGDNRNLMGVGTIQFDRRASSNALYESPEYSGFKFSADYEAGAEGAVTNGQTKGSAWSLAATYSNGPWNGALAYERHKFGNAAGTLATAVPGNVDKQEHAAKIGVGYSVDTFHVGLVYEHTSDDLVVKTGHNAWTLGGGYYFGGNNEAKLAFTHAGDISGTSNTGAKQWAVGVDHILSKRTKVYAEYVRLSNDNGAAYGLTGAGGGTTGGTAAKGAGADPSAFQFGVRHAF